MESIGAKEIRISLGSIEGAFAILMSVDTQQYVQLAVRVSVIASALIPELKKHYGIDAITGMAFDYRTSGCHNKLITEPDARVTGVWVKVEDFPKVENLYNC